MTRIIVSRNGKTTEISGWRAWLIGGPVLVAVMLFGIVAIVLLVGAALTVATLLLFALPLALAGLLLVTWLRSVRR